MRCAAWPRVLLVVVAVGLMRSAVLAQSGAAAMQPPGPSANTPSSVAKPAAGKPVDSKPVDSKPVTSPIQTQFKAYKVYYLASGQEELEAASSVSPGDVVEYVAQHRNVSQRRLLDVDFAIPIPWGTTLWQGSVQPGDGAWVMANPDEIRSGKNAQRKTQGKVVWRVKRLDPGQSVQLKLRVSIDRDTTLAPATPVNPFVPRVPELRRP